MNEKYFILLDNSFKENYCICPLGEESAVIQKFDKVIKNIRIKLPDFEGDYFSVYNSLNVFESIDSDSFNKILVTQRENELKNLFSPPIQFSISIDDLANNASHISSEQKTLEVRKISEAIEYSYNNFYFLYKNELPIEYLKNMINEKLKLHVHAHVAFLREELKNAYDDLNNKGIDSDFFKNLCSLLAWNLLLKFRKNAEDWICNVKKEELFNAKKIILQRLIAYYYNNNPNQTKAAGSILLTKYADLGNNNDSSAYGSTKRQLLDPYITEHAVSGFFDDITDSIKPVIALTCDKEQLSRLKRYIKGRKSINKEFEKNGMPQLPIVPGIMVLIDRKNHEVEVIHIQDCIND